MENNNNLKNQSSWSHALSLTAGALVGIMAVAFVVGTGVVNYGPTVSDDEGLVDHVGFITQQFLSTTTAPNNGNNGPAVIANTNAISPMMARIFGVILNHSISTSVQNGIITPTCDVKGMIQIPSEPGVISYNAGITSVSNPNDPEDIWCGLLDANTQQVIAVANINEFSSKFVNLPAGSYTIKCLTKFQSSSWKVANFCEDAAIYDILPASNVPPLPNPSQIDLELYGQAFSPSSNGSIGQTSVPLRYVFKTINAIGATGGTSSGALLRVLPQNMINIVATGASLSGTWYEWDLGTMQPGNGKGFELFGDVNPNGSGSISVFAELCNYNDDVDSKACNTINLVPHEDDELKL